jgi:hypothetical protein
MTEAHASTLTDEQYGQKLHEHSEEALRAEAAQGGFTLPAHPTIPRSNKPLLLIVLDGLGESKWVLWPLSVMHARCLITVHTETMYNAHAGTMISTTLWSKLRPPPWTASRPLLPAAGARCERTEPRWAFPQTLTCAWNAWEGALPSIVKVGCALCAPVCDACKGVLLEACHP